MWKISVPSKWGDDGDVDAEFRVEEATFVAPNVEPDLNLSVTLPSSGDEKKRRRRRKKSKEATEIEPTVDEEEVPEPQSENTGKRKDLHHNKEASKHSSVDDDVAPSQKMKKPKKERKEKSKDRTVASKPKKETPALPMEVKPAAPKLSALQEKLKKKLDGGHFRFLNEKLYTTTGDEALQLFTEQPELFDIYHKGFRSQVEEWPVNPVDVFVQRLCKLPQKLVVADFGCGEAKLAQSVKQKVHSFDLNPVNEFVTVCDVANVPLEDGTIDIGVFCLSLMGTNYQDFILEARRVLKPNARLWIAEVKSRFEGSDLSKFIAALKSLGFDLKEQEASNKMFVIFDLVRANREPVKSSYALKPCIYKRR